MGDSHGRSTEQGSSNGAQEETPLRGVGWGGFRDMLGIDFCFKDLTAERRKKAHF